jgi:lipid II:glycine glycyltransferase (peptidoglycan interpeptide bridge formation enzyme)
MQMPWRHPYEQFLQSEEWRNFQASCGRQTYVITIDNTPVYAIRHSLPLGFAYWYIPRGPFTASSVSHTQIKNILNTISTTIQKQDSRALFVKIEPVTDTDSSSWNHIRNMYKKAGARHHANVQPSVTRLLDISQDEKNILSNMGGTTRRNIAVAERRGVVTKEESNEDGFRAFWQILSEMSVRQKIKLHEKEYYKKILTTFGKNTDSHTVRSFIYTARFEGIPIAAALIVHYKGVATYLHGATGNLHRDKKALYALLWLVMTDAKKNTCNTIDFFGENPQDSTDKDYKKEWEGFTQFKASFGGTQIRLPGTFEYPIRPLLYLLFRIMRCVY